MAFPWTHVHPTGFIENGQEVVKYYARAYTPTTVKVGPYRATKEEATKDIPAVVRAVEEAEA